MKALRVTLPKKVNLPGRGRHAPKLQTHVAGCGKNEAPTGRKLSQCLKPTLCAAAQRAKKIAAIPIHDPQFLAHIHQDSATFRTDAELRHLGGAPSVNMDDRPSGTRDVPNLDGIIAPAETSRPSGQKHRCVTEPRWADSPSSPKSQPKCSPVSASQTAMRLSSPPVAKRVAAAFTAIARTGPSCCCIAFTRFGVPSVGMCQT